MMTETEVREQEQTPEERPFPLNRKCECGCGRPALPEYYNEEYDMAFSFRCVDKYEGFQAWALDNPRPLR